MFNNSLSNHLMEMPLDKRETFLDFVTASFLGDVLEHRLNFKEEETRITSKSLDHLQDFSLIHTSIINCNTKMTNNCSLTPWKLQKYKEDFFKNSKTWEFTLKPKVTNMFTTINHYSDTKLNFGVKSVDGENVFFDGSSDKSPSVHKENIFNFDNIMSDPADHRDLSVTSDSLKNTTTSSDPLEDILLLDCRSFMSYNAGHIVHACNVHVPNILQRRCKKKMEETVNKCFKSNAVRDDRFDNNEQHDKNIPGNELRARKICNDFDNSIDNKLINKCVYDSKYDSISSKHTFPPLVIDSSTSSITSSVTSSPPSLASSPKLLLPLESIVTCDKTRDKLMLDKFDLIVVYDDRHLDEPGGCLGNDGKVEWNGVTEKLILIMETLHKSLSSKQTSKLRCLQGGYSKFAQCYPNLIEKQEFNLKRSSPPPTGARTVSPLRDRIKWNAQNDKRDPTEILPWLFLGSVHHAEQTQRLTDLGITALLNVASDNKFPASATDPSPSFTFPQSSIFQHAYIPVVDSLTSEIGCHFESAIKFIEKVHQENGKVLVHCSAGVSRSPAVCLAYLIGMLNYTLEEAYEFLRSKRDCIAPNLNFMRQLQEFEKSHFRAELTPSEVTDLSLISGIAVDKASQSATDSDVAQKLNLAATHKTVSQVKKDKLVSTLSSLCMENMTSRSKHNVHRMLFQICSGNSPGNLASKKSMLLLLKTLTSKSKSLLSLSPRKSSILKMLSSYLFIFSGIEHPFNGICSSVTNNIDRSDRLFVSLMRDLQHNMKKVQCKDTRETPKIKEATNSENPCDRFFQVEDGLAPNKEISKNDETTSSRSSNENSKDKNNPGDSHERTKPDLTGTNIENEILSPAKKARPSSLSDGGLCNSKNTVGKSLQPWQRFNYSRQKFQTTLVTFDSACSLPQSPRSPRAFPFSTSSLGSLQQTLTNNLIPVLSSPSSSEAASHPSSPSSSKSLHAHLNNKRKIIVSLLTPTCNQEAAFSFEPPTSIGGLQPSPTLCHSPLLSPS